VAGCAQAKNECELANPQQLQLREFIDLDRFGAGESHTNPFIWSSIQNIFSNVAFAERLAHAFPKNAQRYERTGGAKDLRFSGVLLNENAKDAPEAIDPIWFQLIRALDCDEFRQIMSKHAGIDLTAADIDGGLWLYDRDAFFGPHTDRATRLATLLFYLSPGWRAEWGGRLLILNSADPADVAAKITPSFNSCALIVRSEASWHAVEPVSAPDAVRQVFNVRFFVRGADRNVKPQLTWRTQLREAMQEAGSLGLDVLAYAAAAGSRREPPPFDDADVTEIVYRRFVPVAVPTADLAKYVSGETCGAILLVISSRGQLLNVLDVQDPERAIRAFETQRDAG
jgi:Rps23 Pro-64 3,4-dihydroxylase Tpa1-like proline 4-hydroxylase